MAESDDSKMAEPRGNDDISGIGDEEITGRMDEQDEEDLDDLEDLEEDDEVDESER